MNVPSMVLVQIPKSALPQEVRIRVARDSAACQGISSATRKSASEVRRTRVFYAGLRR
jgi:hypothetical protein